MKRDYLFSVLDLVRHDATDTLLYCLECSRQIRDRHRDRQEVDDELPEYEQKPLDIRIIE